MKLNYTRTILIEVGLSDIISGRFKIPDGVTTIGNDAFYGCSSLISAEILGRVTTIGGYAFAGCSNLASIKIPDGVRAIENFTFAGCSSLTSIEIPNSVTSIGAGAFRDCRGLASIKIPDSVTTIEKFTFAGCSSLTFIKIPDSVTAIGDYAFRDCSSLTSIKIPHGVTTIDSSAFTHCSALKNIVIDTHSEEELNRISKLLRSTSETFPYCIIPISTYNKAKEIQKKIIEDDYCNKCPDIDLLQSGMKLPRDIVGLLTTVGGTSTPYIALQKDFDKVLIPASVDELPKYRAELQNISDKHALLYYLRDIQQKYKVGTEQVLGSLFMYFFKKKPTEEALLKQALEKICNIDPLPNKTVSLLSDDEKRAVLNCDELMNLISPELKMFLGLNEPMISGPGKAR